MSNEQQKNSAERSVRITDAAHKNHDELFPGHVSTLTVTDPKLIEPSTTSPLTRCSVTAIWTPGPG
jgi:hypothetical protein